MLPTTRLNQLGQSLWIDDINRELLDSGTLSKYISEWSVTGLTSNPTIFAQAISQGTAYDETISRLLDDGVHGEDLFARLAIADLSRAADLFLPVHRRTATVDGWVSLEVSPLLVRDTEGTIASAKALHAMAGKPNLFIKIPGTTEGLGAIEAAIFSGVPINVTLLFSPEQYVRAAEAYMTGVERRVAAGLSPDVRSVASVFVSRWDRAVAETAPELKNRLGLAIGKLAYKAYRDLLDSDRWQRLENLGARPQRLLFASTGTKDPSASDVLYIEGLAALNTINTMPQATLKATADHAKVKKVLRRNGGDGAKVLAEFEKAGIGIAALADRLQVEGAAAFAKSWQELLSAIDAKSKVLG
jgi:transaldolase